MLLRCLRVRPPCSRTVHRDAENFDRRTAGPARIARIGGVVKGRRRTRGGMFAKGNSCGRSETTSGLHDGAKLKHSRRVVGIKKTAIQSVDRCRYRLVQSACTVHSEEQRFCMIIDCFCDHCRAISNGKNPLLTHSNLEDIESGSLVYT